MSRPPAVALGARISFLGAAPDYPEQSGRVWSAAAGGGYWVIPDAAVTTAVHVRFKTISRSDAPKHALGRKLHQVTP